MAQQCRVCGCSNLSSCPGGCWWVEDDLCSSCAGDTTTEALEIELAGGPVDGATVEAGNCATESGMPERVVLEERAGAYYPTGLVGKTGLPLYRWGAS